MQKLFLFLFLTLTYLQAQSNFAQTVLKIDSVNKDLATAHSNVNFSKGASGIVIRNFDNEHETIIADAFVLSDQNGVLTLKLTPYDGLEQDVLPSYDIKAKAGDKLILNHLYSRALIIAPNQKSYEQIKQNYSNFQWVHPDLFASKLVSSFKAKPTKEQFQEECKEDMIGLLFFAIGDKAYIVDCKSFGVLGYSPVSPSPTQITPFYTRIKNVKGRLGGLFGGDEIDDFNSYYTKLLGGK